MEEEEKKVEVQSNSETITSNNKFDFKNFFKNFDYKKYLPIAGIVLAVIIVIIILAVALSGGPKKAVKSFINGINKQNAAKVVKSVDLAGIDAWGYSYNVDDFSDDDYDDFIEDYKDVDKDEIKDLKKDMEENMEDSFDEMSDEYKSYKLKIEKFKDVKKLGKDLYAVDAKVSISAKPKDKEETKEIDASDTITFVVYKNKLISLGGLSF